ncbi:LLM class flavin-dependent oxidoreductase [Streptomyces mexicanus]|uniref:LLM class flavin-dependent oxidoreductase n=1 Tax=Streptomyces mexicanus TaxID=178566 RepID=A0A7X1I174_9ACTN|nr:LLM class flavin-dependent oxidoreductase [Streptomyces mexicanus]MBC2866601.1 LLM class flavin-dependent oxidoreductase [Streptomyces mexicanus]
MTARHGRGPLHLAAAVDRPAAPPAGDTGPYVDAVRLAERGGLDFVTLGDDPARPGPDALAVLTRAAPATHRIGLVLAVAAPHPDPCHVPAAVVALDRVSRGRAGQHIRLPAPTGTAEDPPAGQDIKREGDGREAGGERDGREIRREGDVQDIRQEGDVQDVRYEQHGDPPGAARSPQGRPVRVVDVVEEPARPAVARHADVVLVRATSAEQAGAVRERLRAAAEECGRDPDSLRVLVRLGVDLGDGEYAADRGWASDPFARGRTLGAGTGRRRPAAPGPLYRGGPVDLAELIAAWYREGAVDGFHLVPREPARDLERLVNGTVAVLQHRGLFRTFYPGDTLREHLGLARPARTP